MSSYQQGAATLLGPRGQLGLRRRHRHTVIGQSALLLESGCGDANAGASYPSPTAADKWLPAREEAKHSTDLSAGRSLGY